MQKTQLLTAHEWLFETLTPKQYKQALANHRMSVMLYEWAYNDHDFNVKLYSCAGDALKASFCWSHAHQPYAYWYSIYTQLPA